MVYQYLDYFNTEDKERQKVFKGNLKDFFATKKKIPMLKINLRAELEVLNKIFYHWKWEPNLLKEQLEDKYFALNL